MKKSVILFLALFSISLASAGACDLTVELINQDPYPAVPGDYVKLVFQVDGLDSSTCGDLNFELLEDYPIEFDPGKTGVRNFRKIDYLKDYASNILIPFEVRLNKNALDGKNTIEARIKPSNDAEILETFEIEVEDTRADFEVDIDNYNYNNHELTIKVLNIEEADIEALTIEIPKQQRVTVKGSNRVIVGDLDSNEYTSADFEAILEDGEIEVNLIYSDAINVRRTVTKKVVFDSSYFIDRKADQSDSSSTKYLVWIIVIAIILFWYFKKKKKANNKKR